MAEVVVFHHAQGLTLGVTTFANELRGEGHTVHTPDLYDGRTFDTLDEGMGNAEQIGFGEVIERWRIFRGVQTGSGAPAIATRPAASMRATSSARSMVNAG